MRKLGAGWWRDLVAEHLKHWDDYDIPVDPDEALDPVRAPWGRQSRTNWRGVCARGLKRA